jgi:hypothetical protein
MGESGEMQTRCDEEEVSVAVNIAHVLEEEILDARSPYRVWADRFGICLSTLCAVHCILTPVMILALPSLGFVGLLEFHETFHHVLLVVLPLLAIAAFVPGFLRHRDRRVFYWSAPGFLMIALAGLVFGEPHRLVPTVVSVVGSLFLIQAHLTNRRLCACCRSPGCSSRQPK